jgi:3-dehydroquinate synthetase
LYRLCQSEDWQQDLEGLVRQAVQVKIRVINDDPYEKGRRAVLNLGHTVGHALELVSDFQLRHGEAVAIGLVAEAQIAVLLGLAQPGLPDEIASTLLNLGLPVQIPAGMDLVRVLQVMKKDKKKAAGDVKFALPEKIGAVQSGISVDAHLVEKVLKSLLKPSAVVV